MPVSAIHLLKIIIAMIWNYRISSSLLGNLWTNLFISCYFKHKSIIMWSTDVALYIFYRRTCLCITHKVNPFSKGQQFFFILDASSPNVFGACTCERRKNIASTTYYESLVIAALCMSLVLSVFWKVPLACANERGKVSKDRWKPDGGLRLLWLPNTIIYQWDHVSFAAPWSCCLSLLP